MTATGMLLRLRAARKATLQTYAFADDATLAEQGTWRGKPVPLRFRLSWLAEGDETRRLQLVEASERLGRVLTTAQRACIIAGQTRGRLLGTLVGVDQATFERTPAPGEWSLRQVLGHVIATDKRYDIAVQYALERHRSGNDGPLRPPASALPANDGAEFAHGTMDELLARLTATRDEIVSRLVVIADAMLAAPTNWMQWDLDVRFRTHRFAAHDREHTIQIVKTLRALGVYQNEVQLLLADAMAARGALEGALVAVQAGQPGAGAADMPSAELLAQDSIDDELLP